MKNRLGVGCLLLSVCACLSAAAAEEVQVDRIDNNVRARLERVDDLLKKRQWFDAIENLRQLAELNDGGLVAVSDDRFIDLCEWCRQRLAAMPAEGLQVYRSLVDPVAERWYRQGVAERDVRLLRRVVDRAFASGFGDDALLALGDIELERGCFAAARRSWRRILSADADLGVKSSDGVAVELPPQQKLSPHYPDADLDPAAVRARIVLALVLEGRHSIARAELDRFARLHPEAKGRLGHREGKYVEMLESLLTESVSWPTETVAPDWPTFAGDPLRNGAAAPIAELGSIVWRFHINSPRPLAGEGPGVRAGNGVSPRPLAGEGPGVRAGNGVSPRPLAGEGPGVRAGNGVSPRPLAGEGPGVRALCYHPILWNNLVLLNTQEKIFSLRIDDGAPAWGRSAEIFRGQSPTAEVSSGQYTMTVFRDRLYARMGPTVYSSDERSYLVCLDLKTQGRLLWKVEPEQGYEFEGSPLVDRQGVYAAMRRPGLRHQAFVACLEPDSGRIRWRRFVCGAESNARADNLLTLAEDAIYYNTNLGAAAALRTEDGRIEWLSLYPRESDYLPSPASGRGVGGEGGRQYLHSAMNPCLFNGDQVYVAPADSRSVFAFDAADGRLLWKSDEEVEPGVALLGATEDHLIAAGGRLYWIRLGGAERGKVESVWPTEPERPGYGRGLLAGRNVLWPASDKLYIFDLRTARPIATVDLDMRRTTGGNLLTAGGKLLIAADEVLIAIETK
ncbi:MAG: PQQ-like beta-propeller repeat protein [Pirellulales bacterium]|nr:PQQ-like beta-propeller repeat protein [Pirellulales bacterium]